MTTTDQAAAGTQTKGENISRLQNIEVQLTVEVGGTKITIGELLKLTDGSIVELDRLAGETLDILVNGSLLARGEVVLIGERLGIRFTEIISPEKRVNNL
jgi:flagellar motor switch protein FliN/FliY